ncbi:MAG: DUF898 family protein [Pseudomonadota bacterium]
MTIASETETTPWRSTNRRTPADPPQRTTPAYAGDFGDVFWIALGRMCLTILTLGFARFWMITRMRRYYWSSIRVGGQPLEYTGTALELLVGFLMALVIIATYLMVVNLGLAFIGLSVFDNQALALQLPLVALLPFYVWAQYRARRYILARTRWRGIRFGLAPGAWGYVARFFGWGVLSTISLGLLYPLMQFRLSRFVTARSYYGDLAFSQEGRWLKLLTRWLVAWVPMMLLLGVLIGLGALASQFDGDNEATVAAPEFRGLIAALILFGLAAYLGLSYYQIASFRYLNSNVVLAGGVRFTFSIGFWRIVGIYLLGGLLISAGVAVVAGVASIFGAAALFGGLSALGELAAGKMPGLDTLSSLALLGLLAYLPVVATYSALSHALITHPTIRAVAMTTEIHNLAGAGIARQRDHDEQAEAGGFADALGVDAGGAF